MSDKGCVVFLTGKGEVSFADGGSAAGNPNRRGSEYCAPALPWNNDTVASAQLLAVHALCIVTAKYVTE